MKVQVNTDNHIEGSDRLETFINEKMNHALKNYTDRITRVEMHLSNQHGEKSGVKDIQCRVEVRPIGLHPVVVTAHNVNLDLAINQAIEKMKAALTSDFGKLKN